MVSTEGMLLLLMWISGLPPAVYCKPHPCKWVECETLPNCYSYTKGPDCCPSCLTYGCSCPIYLLLDCTYQGYPEGVLPINGTFYKDYGSALCTCNSVGNITCVSRPCTALPPGCTTTVTPQDSHCPQCVCFRPTYGYVSAGTTYTQDCEVCVCPSSGGALVCTVDPTCEGSGF